MPNEFARNISAETPMGTPTRELLVGSYAVSGTYLDGRINDHHLQILGDLVQLDTAIGMSRSDQVNPVVGIHETPTLSEKATPFEQEYDQIRRDPNAKMAYDNELVSAYMRRLGPTNPLRRRDGLDAGFELARVKQLLENDFINVPEDQRRPEMLYESAIISEELALLWTPSLLARTEHLSPQYRDLIATADDRNVFSDEEIATIPAATRWKLVGAKLSGEAADALQAIGDSKTAKPEMRFDAITRATDMRIRELRLRAMATTNKAAREQYSQQIVALSDENLRMVSDAWENKDIRHELANGQLFELMTLAMERDKLVHGKQSSNQLIRLALPREDRVHKEIRPLFNRLDEKINLSADIVVEDTNGNFVVAYQAKAWNESDYHDPNLNQSGAIGINYPSERIEMRYLDSYQLPRTAVPERV